MNKFRSMIGLVAASMFAAELQKGDVFLSERPQYNEPVCEKKNSLPKWKIGESFVYAKDEKTAIKYAKKRGLWKAEYKPEIVKE